MTKQQKRGCVFVFLGVALILLSLGLHLTQKKQDQYAGANAQALLLQLESHQLPVTLPEETPSQPAVSGDPAPMPVKEYLGYAIIGIIRVPSLGVELPILENWDYELLNVAPCRYSGSLAEEDLILMGHNYESHFRPLHHVELGATVEFEDVSGVIHSYTVAEVTTLYKNDGELLPSAYPLTLFTCTPGGQWRVVVRCAAS